uniref:CortBP2 domain-containing protein n=1 Tax=Rhabditophanes sp. KR3021 TaxID=114890 RepID=A0AC35UAB8_9BILA
MDEQVNSDIEQLIRKAVFEREMAKKDVENEQAEVDMCEKKLKHMSDMDAMNIERTQIHEDILETHHSRVNLYKTEILILKQEYALRRKLFKHFDKDGLIHARMMAQEELNRTTEELKRKVDEIFREEGQFDLVDECIALEESIEELDSKAEKATRHKQELKSEVIQQHEHSLQTFIIECALESLKLRDYEKENLMLEKKLKDTKGESGSVQRPDKRISDTLAPSKSQQIPAKRTRQIPDPNNSIQSSAATIRAPRLKSSGISSAAIRGVIPSSGERKPAKPFILPSTFDESLMMDGTVMTNGAVDGLSRMLGALESSKVAGARDKFNCSLNSNVDSLIGSSAANQSQTNLGAKEGMEDQNESVIILSDKAPPNLLNSPIASNTADHLEKDEMPLTLEMDSQAVVSIEKVVSPPINPHLKSFQLKNIGSLDFMNDSALLSTNNSITSEDNQKKVTFGNNTILNYHYQGSNVSEGSPKNSAICNMDNLEDMLNGANLEDILNGGNEDNTTNGANFDGADEMEQNVSFNFEMDEFNHFSPLPTSNVQSDGEFMFLDKDENVDGEGIPQIDQNNGTTPNLDFFDMFRNDNTDVAPDEMAFDLNTSNLSDMDIFKKDELN